MVESFYLVKILVLSTIAFIIALAWTPLLTDLLYKYRMGKNLRKSDQAPIFSKMHKEKAGTPTMGGLIIWVTAIGIAILFALIDWFAPGSALAELNFLSRGQTWLVSGALVASGLVGLADDFFNVRQIGENGGGIHVRHRLVLYTVIAGIGAWWFYFKLGWTELYVPFYGIVDIGWWYIPFFMAVLIGTSFSVNQTDGLDGLAGGTMASAFAAYAVIALLAGQYELAAFCGVVMGALFAFLWFNIYPARFFMGDTGAMSLGVTLAIVALLTNTALLLPIIGAVFVVETVTTFMQIGSKKLFKRKIFKVAPIHHHFEALGWPEPKVVMRFWVISWFAAALGIMIYITDTISANLL
jgi:phospho-N-acetylmuramoyl-pentapeptide-transferase